MTEERLPFPGIKLHRPQAVTGWIARPRLLKLLDQVLQKPVALISAPAGFGKTTLISQWLERCALPNAWLQLDENDREIPDFLSGVIAALRRLFPGCLPKTADLLQARVTVPLTIWKSALLEDLKEIEDTPFILALDDYHLIGNPSVDLLLADVLQHEPLALHLILSARRSPSLSFSRLNVYGRVVNIRTADLRFTDTETVTYFLQTARVALSETAIQQLQVKTEGWAAGLALAALSLRADGQPEELVANLAGSERQVSEYLLDQVFNNQPGEIQEFLLKTATFNQFNASLLQEVFASGQNEREIQALLERVEAAQLFLVPLDNQHSFYRYHHLFRQMLLARQRLFIHPEQVALHHRRAAAWLVRRGQTDEALSHLIAVQDWVSAALLVESQFCALLNAEDFLGIKHRLEHFSEDFIATRPGLLLMQAWMAHFGLRLDLMHALTSRLQVLLDAALRHDETAETGVPSPGFEVLPHSIVQAQVWSVDSAWNYLINQGSQAVVFARQAAEILPESWLFARGNTMMYLGLSMVMEGQYHQAVEMLQQEYNAAAVQAVNESEYHQAVEMLQQEYARLLEPNKTYALRLLFALATAHLLHGELELCRQTAEQLVRGALALKMRLVQGAGYYLLGRVYQEWNQLELAAQNYGLVVEQFFTANLYISLESIAGYVLVLRILSRHVEAQQALDLLQQVYSDQIAATPAPVVSLVAWLKLQNGDRIEALRWAESFNAPLVSQAIVWYHLPQFYKAKILMETGVLENNREVDRLLDEIQELSERTHNNFTLLRGLAMRAVWLSRRGENDAAQEILKRALRLARPGWFILTFVEQGPEMLALLKAIDPQVKNGAGLDEYIDTLIAAFSTPTAPHPAPKSQNEIQTLLTGRELEVLELLAERLSIREISARLYISPSTVQQHTHHIYRKLHVVNKRQAVTRAIELGILTQRHSPS